MPWKILKMPWGTLEMSQRLEGALGDPGDVLGTLKMPWRFHGNALEAPWGHLLPSSLLTLAVVGDDSNGEVDLAWAGTRRGADGVVAGLEQGQLGEEQGGRQSHRGELLQHLQQCRAPEPLPLLVQPRVLQGTRWASATAWQLAGRDPQVPREGASSPVSQYTRQGGDQYPTIPAKGGSASQPGRCLASQYANIPAWEGASSPVSQLGRGPAS